MRRRKNLVPLTILTILFWIFLAYLTFNFPPEAKVRIMNYELGIMNLLFPLVFLAVFSFFSLVLNKTRWGVLLSLGIVIFFILRLLKLTHPFYLVLLITTLIAFEFTFRKS